MLPHYHLFTILLLRVNAAIKLYVGVVFPLCAVVVVEVHIVVGGGMWRVACGMWLMADDVMLSFYIVAGGAKK